MIRKNMSIDEVVKQHPETVAIFEQYGLGCVGCRAALFENIEQGAQIHGVEVSALVKDLNKVVSHR